ncbi:MAG TPA: discoidin domain-containing protein [Polyangia bacterium]
MNDATGETIHGPKAEPTASAKTASRWLGRLLWLGQRVGEVRKTTFGPSKPAFVWYQAARQFCDDAAALEEKRKDRTSSLLLECTAAALLVRCHLARAGFLIGTGPLGEADWENAHQLPAMAEAWGHLSPTQASLLMAVLGPDHDTVLANLTGHERRASAAGIHRLVNRLSAPLDFEANQLKLALLARWARITLAALALTVALGFAARWIDAKFSKPNLALGRPVRTSSQYPGAGENPALLVDGDRENLGFHTNADGQQWVVIDLGAIRPFDKVVVYNRAEGQHKRAVPLRLEVSDDDKKYTLLRERKETFAVWTAKGLHTKGRYIRLQNTPPNYFHLSEVEIY